ncbi:MAG: nucleotidyltransferase family protein [Alistipes sp.]|nr:nucleotidyltransferase family protein [Alistipes sp.]
MKPYETEQAKVVLLLSHTALTQPPDTESADVICPTTNWEAVARLAARQGVLAIAWDGLMLLHKQGIIDNSLLPQRDIRLKWALSVEGAEKRYARQRAVIEKLAEMYQKEGITMTILKGYGLSLCYPTPPHRTSSDIDIWLAGEQQRADDILRTKYRIEISEDVHHHTVFYIDGVMIENHYDFINVHAHTSSRKIEQELKQAASQGGDIISVGNATIQLPNANLHALFLLRHAAAHFAGAEIVLRHIFDWAMFVRTHHQRIDWQWLYGICSEHKMERFAYAMNGLAIRLCGIDSELFGSFERHNDIEIRILNDTLEPEFSLPRPKRGLLRIIWFKTRRWWANRWKRKLVYSEGQLHSFVTQAWSHLLKPKGIKH